MFIQFFIQVRQNPLNLRINVSYVNYRILSLFCHGLDCEAIILFFMSNFLKKLSVAQTIVMAYALVISVGALLLWLPFSSASGEWTSFIDALFTATSATAVTGQ